MNRRFALDTPGLRAYIAGAALVLCDKVYPCHYHAILARIGLITLPAASVSSQDPLHLATLAALLAANHLYCIACLDVHHNTSGANDTIFMKPRSRNSRATGPKMRVPFGF
jgi:hypothetical protein